LFEICISLLSDHLLQFAFLPFHRRFRSLDLCCNQREDRDEKIPCDGWICMGFDGMMNGTTCFTKYFTWRIRNLAHPSPDQKQKWNLEFSTGFWHGYMEIASVPMRGTLMIMAFFVSLLFLSFILWMWTEEI